VTAENRGGIRVNSVGTILPAAPKPVEPTAEKETEAIAKTEPADQPKPAETEKAAVSEELVLTDPLKKEENAETRAPRRTAASRRRQPPRKAPVKKEESNQQVAETTAEAEKSADPPPVTKEPSPSFGTLSNRRRSNRPKKPTEPDPLESINLVIQFKDGKTFEKRMSEVFKFSVDKGVLTVILKDGGISRYPIVEVAKVTIE
jgi:hypothetical protein